MRRLDFARERRLVAGIMSTLVEIEAAIDRLPFAQQRELVERLEERQIARECGDRIFQMYDREEEEMERERKAGKSS